MPHINRIRVNNVKYNFGTQSYEDFVMRLSCKNTIYDLANGGGKSILMLLLLQNMIPNCTLDEKQPIEKLFRAGNDNKVIHSLIEWRLNPCHVKNGFIYMTTGFCARKAKEGADEERKGGTAPIEYFNYCIFYREVNPNDIVNLPLQNKKEKITYHGLKNYLREIGKKDYSLEVHIFDSKGEYQRFISDYGIYESEWELIRGINKTEGHVRTFFENNYKTTRKVVEDLFIEEIIEKSYKAGWDDDENNIARTLLDIKDKLVELAKKKGEIEYFDHQTEALAAFSDRLHSMRGIFGEKALYEEQLVRTSRSVEKEKANLKVLLDDDTKKLADINNKIVQIDKDTEYGKIVIEEYYLNSLLEETNNLKQQYNQMEEDARERENYLQLCEAANSYFDYIENEKQMKINSNAIFDISSKNGDLLEELQALSCHLTRIEEKELEMELTQFGKLEQDLNNSRLLVEKNMDLERQSQTNLAITESELKNNESETKELGVKLEEMRKLSNLSLAEEVFDVLTAKEKKLSQVKENACNLRKQERSLIEMTARMETRKAQSEERFSILEERRNACKVKLNELEASMKEIEKIQDVYGEKGEDLFTAVEEAYRLKAAKLAEIENNSVRLNRFKEKLENPYLENIEEDGVNGNRAINDALQFIKRHYDSEAVLGENYLMNLPKEEQLDLIKAVPYIGACIVMNKNLREAAFDEALSFRIPQNESIVLLLSSELKKQQLNLYGDSACVVANTPVGVLEESKLQQLIKKTEEEIRENDRQIVILKDNLNVLRNDLFLIDKSLHKEELLSEKIKQEYTKVKEELEILFQETESFDENYNLQKEALSKCIEQLNENESMQSSLSEEINLLRNMKDCYEQYAKKDNLLTEQRKRIDIKKKECAEISGDLKKSEREAEQINNKFNSCKKKIDAHREAVARYAVYKTDKEYPVISVDKEELEQLFRGKVLALEEKDSDIADKQRMVDMYRTSMEKCEADIKYRGFTLNELAKFTDEGVVSAKSMEELQIEKEKVLRAKKRFNDISEERIHKQSQLDRQSGIVEHGKKMYSEKFAENYVNKDEAQPLLQIQRFVAESKARLKLVKAEAGVIKDKLRNRDKQLVKLESLGTELTQLIENYDINMDAYSGVLSEEKDIVEACRKVRSDYHRLSRQEQKCRESFEKDKTQLIETLNLLNSKDLADEIQKQLSNPANVNEIDQYIENISQTINCIRLEKTRIGQSIENMEVMKENFVKQCLQTCISIKEALERLPNLSNIQLDAQTISMVKLSIPYIDEKSYSQAMDEYISDIVESADMIDTPAERLKYIRNRLAWKRMFSVLVKDMDKIKLQLYKRERIKEHSRYLKYEEAVGSTGQSQGIYIQFLVAVINYISSINNNKGQGELLRKVIFIDNPFGSAKDIYIWEPIFEMLKSNHVQLIVPARGVTPAITGRFEVNYILGQKLVGGRQQTVVTDYRSQVEEQFLEYKELEYIQTTFDF